MAQVCAPLPDTRNNRRYIPEFVSGLDALRMAGALGELLLPRISPTKLNAFNPKSRTLAKTWFKHWHPAACHIA